MANMINNLTFNEKLTLLKGKKKLPKLFFMVAVRFGESYTWTPITAYRFGDYYLAPNSPLGILRLPLPPREAIGRISLGGYAGISFVFMPDRDMFYFLKYKTLEKKTKKMEVDVDGKKVEIEIPLIEFFNPKVLEEKDFFKIVSKETAMRSIYIEVLERLKHEREALATFMEKWMPTISIIIMIIVVMIVLAFSVQEIMKVTTHTTSILTKILQKVVPTGIAKQGAAANVTHW